MPELNYKMKMAICDDDPEDAKFLRGLVERYLDQHHYHIRLDEYPSGEAFLSSSVTDYPLVILDIFMGDLNGIETAKEILQRHPGVQIIFCSSSNAYAAESYDVSALRYLTKPVEEEKLFRTLDRFFHLHTSMRTLTYKRSRMEEHIYLSEVLWIEADGHNCIIHTKTGTITTSTSISQFAEQLADSDFVKPIRYALVSMKAIAAIPTDVLTLTDGAQIPVSREKRADMKKAFSDFKMRALMHSGGGW